MARRLGQLFQGIAERMNIPLSEDAVQYAMAAREYGLSRGMTEADLSLWAAVVRTESGWRATARPNWGPGGRPASTAEGYFQFLDSAYRDLQQRGQSILGYEVEYTGKNDPRAGIDRFLMIREEFRRMTGRVPEGGENYLMHFAGVSGAARLAEAYDRNPNTPIRDIMSDAAIRANAPIRFTRPDGTVVHFENFTVADIRAWADSKLNIGASTTAADMGTRPPTQPRDGEAPPPPTGAPAADGAAAEDEEERRRREAGNPFASLPPGEALLMQVLYMILEALMGSEVERPRGQTFEDVTALFDADAIALLDTNDAATGRPDGRLDSYEARFFDRNHDWRLTAEEIARWDQNRDGKLSAAEVRLLDINNDGRITSSDVDQARSDAAEATVIAAAGSEPVTRLTAALSGKISMDGINTADGLTQIEMLTIRDRLTAVGMNFDTVQGANFDGRDGVTPDDVADLATRVQGFTPQTRR